MSNINQTEPAFRSRSLYLFAIITFLIFFAYRVALIFYVQPDIGGVEVNVIYFIQQLLDGHHVYQDPEQIPYSIAQYSPFYYYLVAGVARSTGTGPESILTLFELSRTISLLFNILFSCIVFGMGRNIFGISRQVSVVIGILSFIFLQITSFSRPDSLGHFFIMLAFYVFMVGIKKEESTGKTDWKPILFCALISAAALFSKQNAIILPVIFGSWLLLRKQFMQAAMFSLFYVMAVGICLLMMYAAGELPFFLKNVIQGVNNGINPAWFDMVILRDYYHGFGLLFLLLFIILFFQLRKDTRPLIRFSLFALVGVFVLQNLLAIKNGSNPGYFTEWWTLVIVLAAYSLSAFSQSGYTINKRLLTALICFLLVIKIVFLAQPLHRMIIDRPFSKAINEFYAEKGVADRLLAEPGHSDTLKVFPNYYTAGSFMSVLLFRRIVMPQMDIVILASYPYKTYDYTGFINGLKEGRFPWMIMHATGPQKQFYETRLDSFQLKETLNGYNIYFYNH